MPEFSRGFNIMSNAVSKKLSTSGPCELKASTLTIPVLKLTEPDMDGIKDHLARKIEQMPDFFRHAPVVIDLANLKGVDGLVDFALLVGIIRGLGMIPIGVQGGSPEHNDTAEMFELAILGNNGAKAVSAKAKRHTPAATIPATTRAKTILVERPVRSGQRLYARGSDLIVTSAISSGAEILADGNIHVYGMLRGRAMAGIKGDKEARIFCHGMQAELVSIAGRYKTAEKLADIERGTAIQIYLQGKRLVVDLL
jgi:septum site-determining protein MinC